MQEDRSKSIRSIPSWCEKYLNSEDLIRIRTAVKEVEGRTAVEIVPVLARRSVTEPHSAKPFGLMILVFGFFPPTFAVIDHLLRSEIKAIGLIAAVALAMMVIVQQSKTLQHLFQTKSRRDRAVAQRAQLEFYRLGLQSTTGRTGILLFLSLEERQAVVLADQAIALKLAPETWSNVVGIVIKGAKANRLGDGIVAAVAECGNLAAPLFPSVGAGKDELRNDLEIIE